MGESRQPAPAGDRLAKVIARAGMCSRRQAEEWITTGRVLVNSKAVRTPAFNVTDDDHITVDGEPLRQRQGTRVWLYHKPAGKVVTERDPEGRPTIFADLAKKGLPRVMTVGRLDINTEGLLLLTNDGGLKRVLELPSTGWLRRYRVRAHGRIEQSKLDTLKKGMEVDGVKYGSIDAQIERVQGSNVWLNVALREGKNREIKNVLGVLGLEVNRLIRVSFGPFQLSDLPVDAVDTVKAKMLRDQLGNKLSEQAGVDFDAPMPDSITPLTSPARSPRDSNRSKPLGDDSVQSRRKDSRRPAREPEVPVSRRVLFDDGRAPEQFEPKAKKKDDRKDKFSKSGSRPARDDARPDRKGPRPPRDDSRPDRKGPRPPRDDSKPARRGPTPDRAAPRGDRKGPRPNRPASSRPRLGPGGSSGNRGRP